MEEKQYLRVVMAVIWNPAMDEILICQRPETKNFGGLWEFPGGKVEAGETDIETLDRELDEEVGILVHDFTHRMDFKHDYEDKEIEFVVYDVYSFEGEPYGRENQAIRWINAADLSSVDFPPADYILIDEIKNGIMPN